MLFTNLNGWSLHFWKKTTTVTFSTSADEKFWKHQMTRCFDQPKHRALTGVSFFIFKEHPLFVPAKKKTVIESIRDTKPKKTNKIHIYSQKGVVFQKIAWDSLFFFVCPKRRPRNACGIPSESDMFWLGEFGAPIRLLCCCAAMGCGASIGANKGKEGGDRSLVSPTKCGMSSFEIWEIGWLSCVFSHFSGASKYSKWFF